MTTVDDFGDVSRELESLESDLKTVSRQCEEQHQDLTTTVEDTQHELEDRMHRLEQRVTRLTEQLAMSEHRDRAGSEEVADFDTASADEVQAGRDAVTAQQLGRHLLSPQQRQQHQRNIDRAENLRAEIGQQEQKLVRTARAVAELTERDPRSEQHQQAKKAYETAKTALQRTRLQRNSTDEDEARAALRDDKKARAQHGAAIETGQQAEQWLRQQLYDRIGKAVGCSALLPMWFSTALGTTPPPKGVEQWMHTAVSLLFYRRAFAVHDPVVALGPRPEDVGEQQRWHDELTAQLKQHRPS